MKQLAFVSACLVVAFAANAQMKVVKEAERAMKDGKAFSVVESAIKPALTDPETKDLAQTWYIPGTAAYKQFKSLFGKKAFNKLPEGGDKVMADLLDNGFRYYTKALSLDTVVDDKGKVKTKYSDEIVNTIAGYLSDYNNAAITYWELKDFKSAFNAWETYFKIVDNPVFAEQAQIPADTLLGEVRYNQALAAWQYDDFDQALNSFVKARKLGYKTKNLYDYALAVAAQAKNEEAAFELAKEAQELYGAQEPSYVGYIINYYLAKENFDDAFAAINQALAQDPNNAQYYVVLGMLYDQKEDEASKLESKKAFEKALSIDAENDAANYNYGRALCEEAYRLSDKAPTSPAESEKYFRETIKPLFISAAEYLEKAASINPENRHALQYLQNVYYNLNDEAKLKDVENRLAK